MSPPSRGRGEKGGAQALYAEHGFDLTQEMQRFSFEFTMTDVPPPEHAQLELRLGGAEDNPGANSVTIDNLSIVPKP